MSIDDIDRIIDSATMARTPYEMRYFVAGRHAHPMQQYRQLVTELGIARDAIAGADVARRKRIAKRERLLREIDKDVAGFAGELRCEIEELDLADAQEARALRGKRQEVQVILRLLDEEYSEWLPLDERQQLDRGERDYFVRRLGEQAANELISVGTVSAGMIEAIRQMPSEDQKRALEIATLARGAFLPVLEAARQRAEVRLATSYDLRIEHSPLPPFTPLRLRKDAPTDYPRERIVDSDRIDIVIGTLHRCVATDSAISGPFEVPVGKNFLVLRDECPAPDLIGDYKHKLALNAEALGATHLFLLDDDVRCPPNTIRRLWNHDKDVVGAWYARKLDPPDSSTIVRDASGATTGAPDGPGLLEVDGSLAAGCTLYRIAALQKLPRPWFRTTHKGTEDTWFTQLAREHGVVSWLDRDLKVDHVDKATGRAYRVQDIPRRASP